MVAEIIHLYEFSGFVINSTIENALQMMLRFTLSEVSELKTSF